MTGLICLALLATSCRRLPYAPPTVKPTITPTPRSTALPPIPTPVPLGSAKNPLHIVFVALPDVASQATPDADATEEPTSAQAASDLEKALLDAAQMTVKVDVVTSDAEALAALCASPKGTISAAWMGGLAYAAAFAQACGSAALQIQRGNSTGDQARIITGSDKITAIADLADHTFCRLGYSDIYSWLIPSLMIHSGGVADSDLKAINDYTDASVMIGDVVAGKCDAAGISASAFDDLANASARTSLRSLQQSATIPFEVLVVPAQLALAEQQQLSAALIAIGNGTRAGTLHPLLAQDQVIAASDDDLSGLRSFVSGAGIDLAQAGN
ncbi:MAG: PhnD/SsuA/transferrin family substrate-binding protein [Chloroflexota bacterium]